MTLYFAIEREKRETTEARGAGPRASYKQSLRVLIRAAPEGPIRLLGRKCGSVAEAKREIEDLLGPLAWSEANKAVLVVNC